MSPTPSRKNSSSNLQSFTTKEIGEDPEQQKIIDNNHVNSNVMNFPDAKWIQVFINGDEHFSGCRCVVNSRYYRNLDMFLNYLTERLKPSFGAVRNIYSPVNGHPVQRLEDLISKRKYVVAGNERFKKLDIGYTDVIDKKIKRQGLKPKSKFRVSKAKPQCHNTLFAYFHQNGNFKAKPNKVSFLPQDLSDWDSVFNKIREAMKCVPIKRIYALNGKPVLTIEELVNSHSYIVIGKHEVFKIGQYGFSQKSNSSFKETHLSRRSSRKSSSITTGRSSGIYSQASAQSSRIGSTLSKKVNEDRGLQSPAYNTLKISELGNGVDLSDSFKPPKNELKLKEDNTTKLKVMIDLDDDISGIFRSKTQNHLTVGALEIDDSSETAVDLPIDFLDAEEVEDEITPDMERSLQHLTLDVPEEIVAYLPSMQNNAKTVQNSNETQVTNKYNLNHSQSLDIRNIFV